jgi:hypothetical protein
VRVITPSRTAAAESAAFSFIGRDLGDPTEGFTHAYCVGIPDLAALDRYLRQPVHREGDFVFIPLLAKLARTAMSNDVDPDLGGKIMTFWRAAADAQWQALFELIPDTRI